MTTSSTNGVTHFRREDQTAEEWAEIAANHALSAHQSVGELTREVVGLRRDMTQGFRDLGIKMRKTSTSVADLADEIEDTKVRDLRKLVRTHQNRWKLTVAALVSVVTALTTAGLLKAFLH